MTSTNHKQQQNKFIMHLSNILLIYSLQISSLIKRTHTYTKKETKQAQQKTNNDLCRGKILATVNEMKLKE